MTRNKQTGIVFSIYPNANGFGFVYMSEPRKLIDYGSVRINPISNKRVMERIKKSFVYFRPSIVILLDPYGKSSRTGGRVRRLLRKITDYSTIEGLKVAHYSRDQIRDVFEQFGARTKYEISQLLLTEYKELERKSPKKRKLWTSEDRNMAIFDALSLALTHYYLNT